MSAKLQVLALHGSRQDGEVFSQRISTLRSKLGSTADLIFADAPHELPLEEGQSVAMRSWWRHPAVSLASDSTRKTEQYDERMMPDWTASLGALKDIWIRHGGFDAILGFSNGAAAAFLLTCHVTENTAAWPGRKLKCVVLASGYVPQPLQALIPESVLVTGHVLDKNDVDRKPTFMLAADIPAATYDGVGPVHVLKQPLKLPSLHLYSAVDRAVAVGDSKLLAKQFDSSRQQELHDLGHCVPQKANHCDAIMDFLSWFEPSADPSPSLTKALSSARLAPTPAVSSARSLHDDAAAQGGDGLPQGLPEVAPGALDVPISSAEQQEEIDALQAIYDTAFTLYCNVPVKFFIRLAEPGITRTAEGDGGPPSGLFSLVFQLPEGYPQAGTVPAISLDGPLPHSSSIRRDVLAHLLEVAKEAIDSTGSGCCYQIVEAAREWLDANVVPQQLSQPPSFAAAVVDAAVVADAVAVPEVEQAVPWWEVEEADPELIKTAIQAASAAHWARYHAGGSAAGEAGAESASSSDEPDALQRHGRWDYVIGLVGKPSAGKSSLFNALTVPLTEEGGAKVNAQPFTTITPNVGRGWAVVPCPSRLLGLSQVCGATHGHAPAFEPARAVTTHNNVAPLSRWAAQTGWGAALAWRKLPIVIKDVAGLVPGAYTGRGRGNAFLNDLMDADVLIHVVDASGCTDSEGGVARPGEGADPLDDINWVREEVHRWVFDNVRTKWPTVRRRPSKLPDLFTGYHSSRALVYEVLERVGLSASFIASDAAWNTIGAWSEADLHRLVATFLAARFPILLALNKADLPTSGAHIARVREAMPDETVVALSAASERWLAGAVRAGQIIYQEGDGIAQAAPGVTLDAAAAKRLFEINRRVLSAYGSTGALLAVTAAMALRPPRLIFPVNDCASCTALPCHAMPGAGGVLMGSEDAKLRVAEGSSPSVLRDVVLLRPGATPADVFNVLKRPPWQLLEGEYVRAECRVLPTLSITSGSQVQGSDPVAEPGSQADGPSDSSTSSLMAGGAQKQVLRKDDVLGWGQSVIRVMCNRKGAGWQKV